jgi:hypothetical protein
VPEPVAKLRAIGEAQTETLIRPVTMIQGGTAFLYFDEAAVFYTRAQILAWHNGHPTFVLNDDSVDRATKELEGKANSTLALNCDRILIEETSADAWRRLVNGCSNLTIVLTHVGELIKSLDAKLSSLFSSNVTPAPGFRVYAKFQSASAGVGPESIMQLELNFLEQSLRESYVAFSTRQEGAVEVKGGFGLLRSTRLWASGYFDASRLIGNPRVFPWLVSRMADQVEILQEELVAADSDYECELRLLACTRNGAVLGAAIRRLLPDADTIVLDVMERFAPATMPVEFYDGIPQPIFYNTKSSFMAQRYLYIGDFIIGGTELRLAELHGQYRGIPVEAAVIVGTVQDAIKLSSTDLSETLTPTNVQQATVRSLFSLRAVQPDLVYRFPDA